MKKALTIGSIVLIAAVIINYSLGGFKAAEAELVSTQRVVLYGYLYEGRYNSAQLDELLATLRTTIHRSGMDGTITIVNYMQEDLEKRGTVKEFIGIDWSNNLVKTDSLDSLSILPYNAIQFVVPIKPLVMPSPEKLKKAATTMALKMNSELLGFSIEQYHDKNLIINYPFE